MDTDKIQCILIDSKNGNVSQVELESPIKLQTIYDLLGIETFQIVRFNSRNNMYIDDEGLFKDNYFFTVNEKMYAGSGLIVGSDPSGDDVSVRGIGGFGVHMATQFHGLIKTTDPRFPQPFFDVVFDEEGEPDV